MRLRYITGRGGSATEGLSAYLKQQADDFATGKRLRTSQIIAR